MAKKRSKLNKAKRALLKEQNQLTPVEVIDTVNLATDELMAGIAEGMEEEFASLSQEHQELIKANVDIIKDFVIGLREGVVEELNLFLTAANKGLSESARKTSESLDKKYSDPHSLLDVGSLSSTRSGGFGMSAGEFGLSVLGKTFGMGDLAESAIERNRRRESFIQAETKLRKDDEEYKGLSDREIRNLLKKDFARIEAAQKKLADIEKERRGYESAGYSDEDIEKITGPRKTAILSDPELVRADRSNLGHLGHEEEKALEEEKQQVEMLESVDNIEDYLKQIRDLMKKEPGANAITAIAAAAGATAAGGGIGPIIQTPGSRVPTPAKTGGGMLSKIIPAALTFGAKHIGKIGSIASVAVGGYTAINGWMGSDKKKAADIAKIDEALAAGQITPDEAIKAKEQAKDEAADKKNEVVGKGAGQAVGGIAGVKAGAIAGASLGAFLGPLGAAAGGVIGAGIGGFAGSKAGGWLGEKAGGAVNYIKDLVVRKKESTLVDIKAPKPLGPTEFTDGLKSSNKLQPAVTLSSSSVPTVVSQPNIVVQAPPATVINNSGTQGVIPQPFSSKIRNHEPSVSRYLQSVYAY